MICNCFILIIFYLESRQLHEIQVIAISVFQWFDKSHHLSRVAQTRPPFKNSTMAASFTDSARLLILKITFKCTNFQENTPLESGSFSRTVSILGNLPICFWKCGKCTWLFDSKLTLALSKENFNISMINTTLSIRIGLNLRFY